MFRLFVALDIPEDIRQHLWLLNSGVPGARWLEPDQFHLTLYFIGEVDGVTADEVDEILSNVSFSPFPLTLKGVGTFPKRGDPKVLWAGCHPHDALTNLHNQIKKALKKIHDEEEAAQEFVPHVTLARFKDVSARKVAQFLQHHHDFETQSFEVSQFHLYSSALSGDGARYTRELTYGDAAEPFPGNSPLAKFLRRKSQLRS
jgi:2'-5' RNA ligase